MELVHIKMQNFSLFSLMVEKNDPVFIEKIIDSNGNEISFEQTDKSKNAIEQWIEAFGKRRIFCN